MDGLKGASAPGKTYSFEAIAKRERDGGGGGGRHGFLSFECLCVLNSCRPNSAHCMDSGATAASEWDDDNEDGNPVNTPKAGCTAVVGLIIGKMLYVANVGDSRCVLSRKGRSEELSEDHKPNSPDEMKRVIKAGGFVGNGRINGTLNLSRAIGDLEFKQNKDLKPEDQMVTAKPDIRRIELCEDDEFVILACDGIWDCMTSQVRYDTTALGSVLFFLVLSVSPVNSITRREKRGRGEKGHETVSL